jgi:ketosteroid isomerase-like protein
MSQENVDVVQTAYRTLTERGLAEFARCWTEDIEWQTMRTCWYGRQAGRAYLQELVDLFDDWTTDLVEVVDAGGERVVAVLRYGGRSKLTGLQVPPEYFAIVMSIRDGRIATALEFGTRGEALEAVGLST